MSIDWARYAIETDMVEEIKQRITIESEEAEQRLRQVSQGEQELAGSTKGAGDAAERTTQQMSAKDRVLGSLAGNVKSMVAGWIAFSAIAGTVIGLLRDITSNAIEAAKAVAQIGASLRGLSANIGGQAAADVFQDVTEIAAENRFNVEGRAQLLEGVTAGTDIREGLSREQIGALTRNLAQLQRGTGVGGREGFLTIQSLGANLNLNDEQSVDVAAALLSRGVDASAVRDLAERGGNVGGIDVLALLLAAREQGLDVNRAGRALPTVIGALTRREESGELSQELQNLGLTEGQGFVESLEFLVQQRAAGKITEGQFSRAVGGEQNARIAVPLARVLATPGALDAAREALLDPQASEQLIEEITKNKFVRAQERQNVRELAAQVRRERSSLTPLGEELAEFDARHQDVPGVFRKLSFVGNLPSFISPDDPEQDAANSIGDILGGGAPVTIIDNRTIIGTQFNNSDPTTEVLEPAEIP